LIARFRSYSGGSPNGQFDPAPTLKGCLSFGTSQLSAVGWILVLRVRRIGVLAWFAAKGKPAAFRYGRRTKRHQNQEDQRMFSHR
jgi:hypothetical protein